MGTLLIITERDVRELRQRQLLLKKEKHFSEVINNDITVTFDQCLTKGVALFLEVI